jgi:hypothetical protein
MSNTQLFIPTKIKVGFQEREDTYTQKLGYIIYYDNKGVLRKETSWEGWRDKKIDSQEFDNTPTSGFVLNKKAGGDRGHSWEQRQTYSRVYDPRGFEFEITIPNLLFILQECDSSKGKGLEGDFVYAWDGKDLVLLPASSDEYQKSLQFTDLQSQKVSAKSLIEGCIYLDSRMNQHVYLGKYFYGQKTPYSDDKMSEKKQFIFYPIRDESERNYRYYYSNYHVLSSMSTIKKQVSDIPVDNFSTLLQEFLDSPHNSEFSHIDFFPFDEDSIARLMETNNYYYGLDTYRKDDHHQVRIKTDNGIDFYEFVKLTKLDRWGWNATTHEKVNEDKMDINTIINNYVDKYKIYKNGSKIKTN